MGKTRAIVGTEGSGASLSNGDIITEFTWEKIRNNSNTGPDAISLVKMHIQCQEEIQPVAYQPAQMEKTLILKLKELNLNQEGIDISIDYSRNEKSGSFFSRENGFNFGMEMDL